MPRLISERDATDLLERPPRVVRAWRVVDCRDADVDPILYLFRPDVEEMNEREGWCRFAALPTATIVSGSQAERLQLQPPVGSTAPRY